MEGKNEIVDVSQRRKYICDTVSELTYEDTVSVYKFLSTFVDRNCFCTHNNGCSINIDNIDDINIDSLYKFVVEKRK
jgi:hypothetical protein